MQLMFQHSLVVLWLYNTIMEMGNAVRKMMCVHTVFEIPVESIRHLVLQISAED
jgi:hypothetical protein